MRILKDWVIITIPRVGSHYLQQRIFCHTKKTLVLKYHEPIMQKWGHANPGLLGQGQSFWSGLDVDNLKVITIARNPKDLLTSDIAMAIKEIVDRFYKNNIEKKSPYDFVREELRQQYLESYPERFESEKIQDRVNKYTEDYIKLESISNIVIDYNDLVSYPYEVTCAIANRIGIEIITNEYKPVNLDTNKFLVSSKDIPEYEVAQKIVEKVDLSKFDEAYEKIKSKCISL